MPEDTNLYSSCGEVGSYVLPIAATLFFSAWDLYLCHEVFRPLEALLIRARIFVARCFRRSLGMPLVCARGVACLGCAHFATLSTYGLRFPGSGGAAAAHLRAFLLVTNWPFRSC